METYRITIERVSTGERAPSMVVRKASEDEAREYAEAAIRQSATPDDLRVAAIAVAMDERQVRRWAAGATIPDDVATWLEKLAQFHDRNPPPRRSR